ncbi:adhesion G-protein coupled receptor G5-like [Morone saxatilis]|uniref:adhesion G-protein coupled receptor G5-like n=1 Tax=Morone saxatilis TaxID=34816 RepID=UPI0015E23A81|nr:adhesion G-protein coupled receptor G5-like [Morone saxatilis]
MKRMTWWLLCWLLLSLVFHNITCQNNGKKKCCNNHTAQNPRCCMEYVDSILTKETGEATIEVMQNLEQTLEEADLSDTTHISVNHLLAVRYKPKGPFQGIKFYASDNEASSDEDVTNSKVRVQLPRELKAGSNNTIVFCMLTWPETNGTIWGSSEKIHESRLVGLSVRGKKISGLQERVNITMNLTSVNVTRTPSCVFFNFSTKKFSDDGCTTQWKPSQNQVTCSCDHLTYFGVLMVSASLSPEDQNILSYITIIGCSLSLFTLVITVILFITNRKVRADVSMRVHINLAIALILLNVHFLPSQAVAALPSSGLCFYIAIAIHYSLLATLSWMALEGFHLYLLLVKVFNIYIRRYLLKLSLVGWGIPAVIVSIVIIIDKGTYGHATLSDSKSSRICYITNNTVKMVTTVGMFGFVFIFNMIMLGVTVRRIVSLRQSKEFGQSDHDRAKRDICTLLGVITLLGITWGLVFFSFGYLATAGLYLFCILNSLQGFFIFLWFVMSLRKINNSTTNTGSESRTTNSST